MLLHWTLFCATCLSWAKGNSQCKGWCTKDPSCSEGFSLEVYSQSSHGNVCRKDGSRNWLPPVGCDKAGGAPYTLRSGESSVCHLCPEGFSLEVHNGANHGNVCRKDNDPDRNWQPLPGCVRVSGAPFSVHSSDSSACRVGSVLSLWSDKCTWTDCQGCDACSTQVAPSGSPVDLHGHLSVQGNRIVDKNGQLVRLRGMSFFWSQWEGSKYYNADVVQWLAADWNIQLLRLAMAVDSCQTDGHVCQDPIQDAGYLDFPERERSKVEAVVDAAVALGIYVIIDWHTHHAQDHTEEAVGFFGAMAERYGSYPNVLFEPYNEPSCRSCVARVDHAEFWANTVKPYHAAIVSKIRQHTNNIIVLGTAQWSQGMDISSEDPVVGSNLAYTMHFYAGDVRHGAIRQRAEDALRNGIALIATEWGTCHWNPADHPSLGLEEAQTWLDFMAQHGISDANWAISDKDESCSAMRPGACTEGRWPSSSLTEAGMWVRESIRMDSPSWFTGAVPGPSTCAAGLGQCGGRGWCGPTCCLAGYHCVAANEWWSDCQPVADGGRRLLLV